ncbi:MAG: T9SS type A sorting domain-containing protein [Flavobacteriales bacterium]|nr:T9SS type A sorting domain-containing protein [Flavobacteriales bacterium]
MTSKLFLTTLFSITLLMANAQLDTLISNISSINSVIVHGDFLYATEGNSQIVKLDLNNPGAGITQVVSGLNATFGFEIYGSELFFGQANEIVKIDLNATNPTPTIVASGFGYIVGLALHGNFLYYSDWSNDLIGKLDLSSTSPTPVNVISSGLTDPHRIEFKNDELYILEETVGQVTKFDVTAANPTLQSVTSNINVPTGITFFVDSTMFVSEFTSGNILKYDLTVNPVVPFDTIFGGIGSSDLWIDSNMLYIADFGGDQILVYSLAPPVSVGANYNDTHLSIFPNPSSGIFDISGNITSQQFKIFDQNGQSIEVNMSDGNKIDLTSKANGVYFLICESKVFKLIKF